MKSLQAGIIGFVMGLVGVALAGQPLGRPVTDPLKINVLQINSGTTETIKDSAANTLGTFVDLGTTGALSLSGDELRTSAAAGITWKLTDGTNNLITVADAGTTGNLVATGWISTTDNLYIPTGSRGIAWTANGTALAGTLPYLAFISPSIIENVASGQTAIISVAGVTTSTLSSGGLRIQGGIGIGLDPAAQTLGFSGTTPTISIGNTGTLSFTDGTNTLMTLSDLGTVGALDVPNTSGRVIRNISDTNLGISMPTTAAFAFTAANTFGFTFDDATNTLLSVVDLGTAGYALANGVRLGGATAAVNSNSNPTTTFLDLTAGKAGLRDATEVDLRIGTTDILAATATGVNVGGGGAWAKIGNYTTASANFGSILSNRCGRISLTALSVDSDDLCVMRPTTDYGIDWVVTCIAGSAAIIVQACNHTGADADPDGTGSTIEAVTFED